MSGEYLRNTLHLDLLTKLLTHVNISASGPEVLAALILVIHATNFEIMEQVRDKLRAIKLSDYSGEDIDALCADQLILLQRMDDAGSLKAEHLSLVTMVWKTCSQDQFRNFALDKHKKIRNYRQQLEVIDPDLIPVELRVDYEDLIREARSEYKELKDQNDWTPTLNLGPVAEPTLPSGYQAIIPPIVAPTQTPYEVQLQALMAAFAAQTGVFRGRCDNCGETGHKKVACPKPLARPGGPSGTGGAGAGPPRSGASGFIDWSPPTSNPDTATKEVRGATRRYCSICGDWRYHHAPDHAAWLQRKTDRENSPGGRGGGRGRGGAGRGAGGRGPRAALATPGEAAADQEESGDGDFIPYPYL